MNTIVKRVGIVVTLVIMVGAFVWLINGVTSQTPTFRFVRAVGELEGHYDDPWDYNQMVEQLWFDFRIDHSILVEVFQRNLIEEEKFVLDPRYGHCNREIPSQDGAYFFICDFSDEVRATWLGEKVGIINVPLGSLVVVTMDGDLYFDVYESAHDQDPTHYEVWGDWRQ